MVKKLSSLKYSNFSKIFETVDNIDDAGIAVFTLQAVDLKGNIYWL